MFCNEIFYETLQLLTVLYSSAHRLPSSGMDDDLILNLDVGDVAQGKVGQGKKGGRWTDRYVALQLVLGCHLMPVG